MHGAGLLPGRHVDKYRLQAAGLGGRPDGYSSEVAKNGKSTSMNTATPPMTASNSTSRPSPAGGPFAAD